MKQIVQLPCGPCAVLRDRKFTITLRKLRPGLDVIRASLGMSNASLAKAVGVSPSFLSRACAGKKELPKAAAKKLAALMRSRCVNTTGQRTEPAAKGSHE